MLRKHYNAEKRCRYAELSPFNAGVKKKNLLATLITYFSPKYFSFFLYRISRLYLLPSSSISSPFSWLLSSLFSLLSFPLSPSSQISSFLLSPFSSPLPFSPLFPPLPSFFPDEVPCLAVLILMNSRLTASITSDRDG